MSNFDYNRHTVVGELTINTNSGHGYVKVYGYMDGYKYISLSAEESNRIFTPKGEVFAFNIVRDYSSLDRKLIALSVRPNDKEGDNRDDFVCDYYRGGVRLIGNPIKDIARIGVLGEYNYTVLQAQDLLGKDEPTYFRVKDKLYCLKDKTSRLVPYCTITSYVPIINGKYGMYYIGGALPYEEGVIDITNDKQLISWFIKNIVKVCWNDIQSGNGKLAQEAAKQALEASKNLSPDIVKRRLQRITTLTETFAITRDEIQSLSTAPWLQPTMQKALIRFKDDYIDLIMSENADEINSIRKEHKLEIQKEKAQHDSVIAQLKESMERALQEHDQALTEFESDIKAKKYELNKLIEDIADKEKIVGSLTEQLNSINERKDSVVADFEVIKEVLGLASPQIEPSISIQASLPMEQICTTETKLPLYRGFNKNLENCLQAYGCQTDGITALSTIFRGFSSILLPNIESLMATIYATGKCRYITSYVNVTWKSFEDLWNNGLSQIIDSCNNCPQEIHYLILRNINLSYIPNYMQPLFDVQMGYTNTLPKTKCAYPSNLKVLMTATEDDVIPLTKDSLQYVGCISKDLFNRNILIPNPRVEKLMGYLDVDLLQNEKPDFEELAKHNHIEDYINE